MRASLHHEIGLKIADEHDRRDWISLVTAIAEHIEEEGLSKVILFHGTTTEKAQSIMSTGMQPADAFEVLPDGTETMTDGSFWGTVRTAAWYAEDKSFYREGESPVLIACPVSFLQTHTVLGIDIPSRDFPIPGLTLLEDPEIASWWATGMQRAWQDSLSDLASVTALHEYDLSLDAAVIIEDIESLERILERRTFSS